jgi:hypothetical protein
MRAGCAADYLSVCLVVWVPQLDMFSTDDDAYSSFSDTDADDDRDAMSRQLMRTLGEAVVCQTWSALREASHEALKTTKQDPNVLFCIPIRTTVSEHGFCLGSPGLL